MSIEDKTILYIEDNATNRFLMEMIFRHFNGYTLTLADTVTKGCEKVLSSPPDLILLSNVLSPISGDTTTQLLKESLKKLTIPIIIITTDCTEALLKWVETSGYSCIEFCPTNVEKLQNEIIELLSKN